MVSRIIVLSAAAEELGKLPKKIQVQVSKAIDDLEAFPERRSNVLKLKPPFVGYRKRAGDYRILFDFSGDTVYIHRILDRKDAYR